MDVQIASLEDVANLWSNKRTAEFFGIQPPALKTWRRKGYGPPCRVIQGKPYYLPEEVIAWVRAQPSKVPAYYNHQKHGVDGRSKGKFVA